MKRQLKRLFISAVIIAALIGGGIFLAREPLFKVKSLDCRLNAYPCPLSLEPVLLSFIGKNIFLLDGAAVSRQIMSFDPTLTDIRVTKSLPSRLNLDLTRRLPVAEIDLAGGISFSASVSAEPTGRKLYLDKSGFIYTPVTFLPQSLPLVWWPESLPLVEGESALSRELARLVNTLNVYYVGFTKITRLPDESLYVVETASGPKALIGIENDFAPRVGSLQFILSNIKIGDKVPDKIDLRFDKPILTY